MLQMRIPLQFDSNSWDASHTSDDVQWQTGWPDLVNTLATKEIHLKTVRALRRKAYKAEGMVPTPEVIGDDFDSAANSRIYLLHENSQPLGTIRLLLGHSHYNLPTFFSTQFSKEIAQHVGGPYLEVSRLAVIHPESAGDPRHIMALMQNVTAEADRNASRYILAALDREHLSFYSSLGFRAISEARPLPGWPEAVTLGCLDFFAERSRLRHHYGFRNFFSTRNHAGDRSTAQ